MSLLRLSGSYNRLGKLYDALETGEFKGGELAPRIKALFQKKEELQQAKAFDPAGKQAVFK